MIQSAVGLILNLKIAPKSQELFDSQECKITNWRNLQSAKTKCPAGRWIFAAKACLVSELGVTNQSLVFRSCDQFWPIRGRYWLWMTDDQDVIDTIQLVYFLTHPSHLFLAAHSMSYKPLKVWHDFRYRSHWPVLPSKIGGNKLQKIVKKFTENICPKVIGAHQCQVMNSQFHVLSLFIWNIFGRIVSLKASLSPVH